jgi:hypothetical protein
MPVGPISIGLGAHDVVLADGSTACVRGVTAEDGPQLVGLLAGLSPETVRLRYFGAHPRFRRSK